MPGTVAGDEAVAGLVGVAVWLLVVVLGSAAVWAVVSRAGEGVVSSDGPPFTSDPTGTGTSSPGPTERPTDRSTGGPTDPSTESPTGRPTGGATGSPGGRTGAPPPRDDVVRRTWQGVGGVVVVACRGPVAALDSAQPDPGFSVEPHETGPDRVEVRFEGRGEDDRDSRVRATCRDGVPVFDVDTD